MTKIAATEEGEKFVEAIATRLDELGIRHWSHRDLVQMGFDVGILVVDLSMLGQTERVLECYSDLGYDETVQRPLAITKFGLVRGICEFTLLSFITKEMLKDETLAGLLWQLGFEIG